PNNISGRLHFRKDWPAAAAHIFGEVLMRYDEDGPRDKAHRTQMEIEAEERRQVLLEALADLEIKSVYHGSLQFEHVGKTVKFLGRDIALYIYSAVVVDRFLPPPVQAQAAAPVAPSIERPVVAESTIRVPVVPPIADDVMPIDVTPAAIAPIVAPAAKPAIFAPVAAPQYRSGLNLAAKRNIVQVDFIYVKALSYKELVAEAEKEANVFAEEVVIPQPTVDITADPPVPYKHPVSLPAAQPIRQLPRLSLTFNQCALGLTSYRQ
ncbi:MAG TPA: hypothetical protein DEA55_06075, partial [Rhodospirillaceae bacterium]|nr:hypothetical protein [Rhodospirillaceae bacterium]